MLSNFLNGDYVLSMPCFKNLQVRDVLEGLMHIFYHHINEILGQKKWVKEGDKKGIGPLPYSLVRNIRPSHNHYNNIEFRENNLTTPLSGVTNRSNQGARATRSPFISLGVYMSNCSQVIK